MSRREGSPGYRAPSIDPLECRFLLSALHNYEVPRTPPTVEVAAAVARRVADPPDNDISEAPQRAANVPANQTYVAGDGNDNGVAPSGDAQAVLPIEPPDPDPVPDQRDLVGLTTGDVDVDGPGVGRVPTVVLSPDAFRVAPTAYSLSLATAGAWDGFARGTPVEPSDPPPVLLSRTSPEAPERPDLETRVDLGAAAEGTAGAPPRRSDLLSDFLPFERGALEEAFDRFFDQLHDFAAGLPGPQGSTDVIPDSLIVAAALATCELGRRYLRRRGRDEADSEELIGRAGIGIGGFQAWPGS